MDVLTDLLHVRSDRIKVRGSISEGTDGELLLFRHTGAVDKVIREDIL